MPNETYDRLIEEAGDDIVKKLRFVADYMDAQEDVSGTQESALMLEAATEIGRLRYLLGKEGINFEVTKEPISKDALTQLQVATIIGYNG